MSPSSSNICMPGKEDTNFSLMTELSQRNRGGLGQSGQRLLTLLKSNRLLSVRVSFKKWSVTTNISLP